MDKATSGQSPPDADARFGGSVRRVAVLGIAALLSLPVLTCSDNRDNASVPDRAAFEPVLDRAWNYSSWPLTYSGASFEQFASWSRNGDNFNDGFLGTYSSLYDDEANGDVLVHVSGAGLFSHLWMTHAVMGSVPDGEFRLFTDGARSPTNRWRTKELFGGEIGGLEYPLVGDPDDSSGGMFVYAPAYFSSEFKLTYEEDMLFYHASIERWPAGVDFALADPANPTRELTDDDIRIATKTLWEQPGFGNVERSVVAGTREGDAWVLSPPAGPAMLENVTVTMPGYTTEAIERINLQADWDGMATALDGPLDLLFVTSGKKVSFTSLLASADAEAGVFKLTAPMPYRESALLRLVGEPADLDLISGFEAVSVAKPDLPANAAYFRSAWKAEITELDRDFVTADLAAGCGQIVGYVLSGYDDGRFITEGLELSYLEGDARVYLNGSRSPQLHDTGTEDLFNAGWYFMNDEFATPTHGCPAHNTVGNEVYTMYRWFVPDAISYRDGFRFGIEHGGENEWILPYRSLVYYYGFDDSAVVWTDEVDFGDAGSMEAHGTSVEGVSEAVELDDKFVGDIDAPELAAAGIAVESAVEFDAALIPGNRGLVLRLTTDAAHRWVAIVSVDGEEVGVWRNEQLNEDIRALEHEYVISEQFTDGKSSVRLRLENMDLEGALHLYTLKAGSLSPCAADPGH